MRLTRLVALLATLALLVLACEADDPEVTEDATATPTATATAGVGGDPTVDSEVLERVAEAAGNTVDEGTARFTITAGNDSGTAGTVGDATSEITVEGEVDFEQELRELRFVGPQGELTAIVDGSDLYVQLPATEDDEWARIELEELTEDDIDFAGPAGIPFQDPQRTLDVLREAAVEARELEGGATGTAPTETETDGLGASPTETETDDVGAADDAGEIRPASATATETETDGLGASPTETETDGPGASPTETETDGPGASPTETETDGLGASPTESETDGLGASPTETATDGASVGGRFLVVIDLERAAEVASGEGRQFAAMAEQYGIDTLDMGIVIDDRERIESITYTLPLSQARVEVDATATEGAGASPTETGDLGASPTETETDGLGASPTETATGGVSGEIDPQEDLVVTITYHDFGSAVDITVPDDDDVVDLDEGELRQMTPQAGTGTGTGRGTGTTASPSPTETPTGFGSPSPTETATD